MAPKKGSALPDELHEIRKSPDFLSGEITTIASQQKKIMVLVGEIQELKKLNMEKDKKIALLEKRVDDLEQYSRGNYIVISGLETRHRSYANVVATVDATTERRRAEETEAERESLEG